MWGWRPASSACSLSPSPPLIGQQYWHGLCGHLGKGPRQVHGCSAWDGINSSVAVLSEAVLTALDPWVLSLSASFWASTECSMACSLLVISSSSSITLRPSVGAPGCPSMADGVILKGVFFLVAFLVLFFGATGVAVPYFSPSGLFSSSWHGSSSSWTWRLNESWWETW